MITFTPDILQFSNRWSASGSEEQWTPQLLHTPRAFWARFSVGANLSGCAQQRMRGFTVLIVKDNESTACNDRSKLQHPPMNLWFIVPSTNLSLTANDHFLWGSSRVVHAFPDSLQSPEMLLKFRGSFSKSEVLHHLAVWCGRLVVKNKPRNDRFLFLCCA